MNPRARALRIGLWLMLGSLSMLFLAGLLGYLLVWTRQAVPPSVGLPGGLWLSTVLLFVVSFQLERSCLAAKRQQPSRLPGLVRSAGILGAVFLAVQILSLTDLLESHYELRAEGFSLLGLVFFLLTLHGLHVVAGALLLFRTLRRIGADSYDHEWFEPLRSLTLYWHFLGLVWVILFSTLLFTTGPLR